MIKSIYEKIIKLLQFPDFQQSNYERVKKFLKGCQISILHATRKNLVKKHGFKKTGVFNFLWDSSVNLFWLLRKIGRHGPQIRFPRYASLEKQNGDSFSQNMAFLSLFCGLQYLSSKCPEEKNGKHCLETLNSQFISEVYGEVFDKLGKNPRGCKKCIQSAERKVSRKFFFVSDIQHPF